MQINNLPDPKSTAPEIISSIIDRFLEKSKCANDEEKRKYLNSLLGNKRLITSLLYSGNLHGWEYNDFHSRCDKQK
jgi:hypothetical protein